MPAFSPANLALLLFAWLAFCLWAWHVCRNPRGDIPSGIIYDFVRIYVRVFHGLRVTGREHVPLRPVVLGRPIIIVANHTAGLDPVLIQSVVPFFVRWMMAEDMKGRHLDGLWDFLDVIMVDRSGRPDVPAFRQVLKTCASGNSVGIFPEGKLRRTPRELNPFQPGVSLMIAKTNALVLPVVITGTPHCQSSWSSLFIPSRSRLVFKPLIDFQAIGIKPADMSGSLQAMYVQWLTQAGEPPVLADALVAAV